MVYYIAVLFVCFSSQISNLLTGQFFETYNMNIVVLQATALLLKLKLIYYRQSVGQSVLVSGAHLGPSTNFSFPLKFPSDSCFFVIL
jgi:hypothetical protein